MRIPRRVDIRRVAHDDPLDYYYRTGMGWAFRRRLEMGLDLLGHGRYESLLDVGYGSGIFLPELARRASTLVGVDVHQRGSWVREMMQQEGAFSSLVTGNILKLPFRTETFDAVVCMSVLEHILPIDSVIHELFRILRPGGVLVIGVPRTGRIMNLLFRLIGAGHIEDDHVGDARTILSALSRRLDVEETLTFPGWMPPASALYTACRARKR